jgi:Ala-tRNA(Pro) deacylase
MTTEKTEDRVIVILSELGIPFVRHDHPPVATVEEAEEHWGRLRGAHCKNLFLRNSRGNRHYLVIAEARRGIDLKALSAKLREDRLSFASAERLRRFLGVEAGSVSPFGLINDEHREVRVVIERALRDAAEVNFHPNINTSTLGVAFADFERFLTWCGNSVEYVDL